MFLYYWCTDRYGWTREQVDNEYLSYILDMIGIENALQQEPEHFIDEVFK